tara:strand:+ start:86 stop:646 length:561 start_codon:yes stop_codon:yes gene_type:complete
MAESFSNSLKRAVGITSTTSAVAHFAAGTNVVGGINTTGITTGNLVVNQHFRAGAKVTGFSTGTGYITVDRNSTNTTAVTGQIVSLLGVTTCYTSSATDKSILIGGTFANLTESNINVYVEIYDNSAAGTAHSTSLLASDIPIPNGSSFVISEAGKTVIEQDDQVRVYCDTASAVDVNLAILSGVS